jgi:hypothetical protein
MSSDTIYKWLRSGRLQGWQFGGAGSSVLVSEASVQTALLRSLGRANIARKPPAVSMTSEGADHAPPRKAAV